MKLTEDNTLHFHLRSHDNAPLTYQEANEYVAILRERLSIFGINVPDIQVNETKYMHRIPHVTSSQIAMVKLTEKPSHFAISVQHKGILVYYTEHAIIIYHGNKIGLDPDFGPWPTAIMSHADITARVSFLNGWNVTKPAEHISETEWAEYA